MPLASAPFRYEEPLTPDQLIDRDGELAMLLARAAYGRNTRLVAPRRFGKTSLLRRLLRDASDQGIIGVYVDFYGVLTIADVAARIELAYAAALPGSLRRWFSGVRRTLHPVGRLSAGPASVQVGGAAAATTGEAALLERLVMPRRLAEKSETTVLVVFDEFQDVLAAGGSLDATFRSEIQHHGDQVAYVFAGSQPGMMRELFTSRQRPFFDQASPVELGGLPDDALAAHIGAVFERGDRSCDDVLDALLELAGGHPQRAMQLAAHLWSHTPRGSSADHATWERTIESVKVETADAFRARWEGLPVSYRRTLSAIAAGDVQLLGKAAQAAHGTRPGASDKAAKSLRDTGDIIAVPDAVSGWRLIDPLWNAWIRSGREPS